jgi:hypothetical protein
MEPHTSCLRLVYEDDVLQVRDALGRLVAEVCPLGSPVSAAAPDLRRLRAELADRVRDAQCLADENGRLHRELATARRLIAGLFETALLYEAEQAGESVAMFNGYSRTVRESEAWLAGWEGR